MRRPMLLSFAGIACLSVLAHPALAAESAPPNQPVKTAAPGTGPSVNGESVTERTMANSPVDQFGARHTLAISSDAAISIQNTSLSGVDGSTTSITLAPAVDYFVIQNLSVGGTIAFNYTAPPGDGHSTSFGIGPRVGYNIGISDLISIWPKAGLSISHTSVSTTVPASGSTPAVSGSASNTALALNLFVPVMFHPAPHFFAGFGPFLDTDLSGDNKATTFGGKLTIGGWFAP